MPDESGQLRSPDRTRSNRLPTPRDGGRIDAAALGGGWLVRGAWPVWALSVMVFAGTDGYAEAGKRTVASTAEQVTMPSPLLLAPACRIRIERWEDSCVEETPRSDETALDHMREDVVDFDQFSFSRRQRDKDHLVYRSSEAFGPQFSLVVVEPRTRAFNLGVHLRFEYAF